MRRAIRFAAALLLVGLGLGACSLPEEPHLNWAEPKPGAGSAIVQCYRTLAEPDCSTELRPEQQSRAVGWFDSGRPGAVSPSAE